MKPSRLRRPAVFVAFLACLALTTTTAPALGAPPVKIGAVTGLSATVTKPGVAYELQSSWNAATNATSYQVKLLNSAGIALDTDSVTGLTATSTATGAAAGSTVRVVVTPFNGTRKGRAATVSKLLPDLTAPTGAYDLTHDTAVSTVATVTEASLADDVSAPEAITRNIDWGQVEGVDSWEPWTTGTVLQHEYPTTLGVRYQPRVRLQDLAGNSVTYLLRGVVIGDDSAPTGTFTVTPLNPWAKLNRVTLTQTAIDDNFTPNANIERLVNWGDGTSTLLWSSGTVLTHLYTVGGPFKLSVSLADEALNQVVVAAGSVNVRVDSTKPTLRLRIPAAPRAVKSWLTLRGRAQDGTGTGVKTVEVRAVEKRGTVWYAFKPALRVWVKAGSTKAGAFSKAGVRRVTPTATGLYAAGLPRLRLGVLVVCLSAVDRVGNRSATVSRRQVLVRY